MITSRGVSLSSDVIHDCCERGIPLTFLTPSGQPYAQVCSPNLNATIRTRREQIAALNDLRGVEIAKNVTLGKLRNQANLLKYFAKYRKRLDPDVFNEVTTAATEITRLANQVRDLDGAQIDEIRGSLLNLEGRGGAVYWQGVGAIIGEKTGFERRERRGATDPVNAALNYGYGILYSRVWTAVILAGLEPFAGFLHVDRSGKPSMVLDMMEEFRQPIVDRVILASIGKGFRVEVENPGGGEAARLTEKTRREIATKIVERLESQVNYQGKRWRLGSVIQMQCRRLASFLRGEADYSPYVTGW